MNETDTDRQQNLASSIQHFRRLIRGVMEDIESALMGEDYQTAHVLLQEAALHTSVLVTLDQEYRKLPEIG